MGGCPTVRIAPLPQAKMASMKLLCSVRRGICYPKLDSGGAPAAAMVAYVKLGGKRTLFDLTIDCRAAEACQRDYVRHPQNFVALKHGDCSSQHGLQRVTSAAKVRYPLLLPNLIL
jgi:hypothetical protein